MLSKSIKKTKFSLDQYFSIHQNDIFLANSKGSLTYGKSKKIICQIKDRLQKKGFKSGGSTLIMAEPSFDYVLLLFALWQLEVTAFPINPQFPIHQILRLQKESGINRIIVSDEHESLFSDCSEIFLMNELILQESIVTNSLNSFSQDFPATAILTSGSTQRPKIATHHFSSHIASAEQANSHIVFEPRDQWLVSLPFFHVGGLSLIFRAIVGGGSLFFLSKGEKVSDLLLRNSITHISLVATQYKRLIQDERFRQALGKLKCILLGGGPLRGIVTENDFENLPIYCTYGMTEAASQIATTDRQNCFTKARILKNTEVCISKDCEILIRGKTLFAGYLRNKKIIKENFDQNGWFSTGDLGSIDSRGFLEINGRKDNMFVSGGENIHPETIEAALMSIDGIENAMVMPIEHHEFGFRPYAAIQTARWSISFLKKVIEDLKVNLPRYLIPDCFVRVKEKKAGLKWKQQEIYEVIEKLRKTRDENVYFVK